MVSASEIAAATIGWIWQPGRLAVALEARGLLGFAHCLAPHHPVEVHLVAVELGPVHADVLRDAVHHDAAPAAHPGAVHHDGVQAHERRHSEGLCCLRTELHHDRRADREGQVDVASGGAPADDQVLQHVGHESLPSGRSVVRADEDLFRRGAEAVIEDQEVFAPRAEDRHDLVPRVSEGARDREHGRGADAARHAGHRAPEIAGPARDGDMRGVAERAGHVGEGIPDLERLAHLERGLADGLHDERDGPRRLVAVRDRQGNALRAVRRAHHHELAGPVAPRHARGRAS